uniref:UBA domain-containing protein n=1 Tax=Globisporangium ultimum (strain ATCC 200006 / CBS 805.95 / DAOM BR144) TaxID=431595 RepID=K3X4M5_GLOUD
MSSSGMWQQQSPQRPSNSGALRASQESDIELMRTILGEHVPQSVILTCLNVCGFDVSAALNWYFMEVGVQETDEGRERGDSAAARGGGNNQDPMLNLTANGSYVPVIQSGLSLTLHSRYESGMISKTDAYYATLTRGLAAYDMLTPSNEKFLTIRLRKRGWRTATFYGAPSTAAQRPYFTNGDIVTLECNGLWLKANQLNKVLQWKPPSEDDRNKFVIRGLPLGRNLRPGDYFFLTSYRWKDKEIVMRDERPVGMSSYNTSVHRCFLGLERIKAPSQRLYFYAKLTENAMESLPQPNDPVDINHLTINVAGTPQSLDSIDMHEISLEQVERQVEQQTKSDTLNEEIIINDAKVDQMASIIGNDVSRDRLASVLDGAGGDVQIALEHYFMSLSTSEKGPSETNLVAPSSIDQLLKRKISVDL